MDRAGRPVEAERRVRAGEQYLHRLPATREPDVNVAIRVLYEDAALVVIDKPAPLPIHASGRYNRNTLGWILNEVYAPQKLRPVHRLDANTTGVVVFARTRQFARPLMEQFAAGLVEKVYLARIAGEPEAEEFVCAAPIGSEQTALGGRAIDAAGVAAQTEFRVLRRFADGTTLVEARPIDGADEPDSRTPGASGLAGCGRAGVPGKWCDGRDADARGGRCGVVFACGADWVRSPGERGAGAFRESSSGVGWH